MLICDKVQQNLWQLRLTERSLDAFVHLTALSNTDCAAVSEEDEPPVVETCLSERLKLPFDPQLYLGGINDGVMNKREIPIHLAPS